jgi:hypothetical protein
MPVTLPCVGQDYFVARTMVVAMFIQSVWPAIGLLITALPLIGAGIWAAVTARHHQKRADHWAQFGAAR